MPSSLTISISFSRLNNTKKLPTPRDKNSKDEFLPAMSQNFRHSFWRVFQRLWSFEFPTQDVAVFGLRGKLSRVHLLEAAASPGKNAKPSDYVLCASIDLPQELDDVRNHLANARASVKDYIELIKATPAAPVLNALSKEINGHSSWASQPSEQAALYTPIISAYFHHGWVQAQRIEREQLMLEPDADNIGDRAIADKVIQQRLELLAFERCFLADGRSPKKELREICDRLLAMYKLKDRAEKLSERHALLERHVTNAASLTQARAAQATNFAVRVLAFGIVPIGIAGTIFAVLMGPGMMNPPG